MWPYVSENIADIKHQLAYPGHSHQRYVETILYLLVFANWSDRKRRNKHQQPAFGIHKIPTYYHMCTSFNLVGLLILEKRVTKFSSVYLHYIGEM